MLSLLPQQLKKEVEKEYKLRLAVVGCFLLAAVGVLSSLALIPYIAFSSVKENAVKTEALAFENEHKTAPVEDFSAEVRKTKTLIATFASRENTPTAEDLIERLVRTKPSKVSLSSIAIARNSTSTAQVIVEGVSADRDALLYFVQELKKVPLLKSVVLPVSNFAKAENIEFSLTILATY